MTSPDDDLTIYTPNNCNIDAGDILVIAGCTSAHMFEASAVSSSGNVETIEHKTPANKSDVFCRKYDASGAANTTSCISALDDANYQLNSELLTVDWLTYYIADGENGEPALHVYDEIAKSSEELIEGVEDLQIKYGVDNDNDSRVDEFKTANEVVSWDTVISAELSILVASLEDNITTDRQQYKYNGASVTATDGKLRRVFTTSIGVRNRVQ